MTTPRRPDMRAYFAAKIDRDVNGMMSHRTAILPAEVVSVRGTVRDREITVTTRDGSVWRWKGGQYAARKVNGCYAPKMPTPVAEATA